MAEKNVKKRNWAMVLYPESAPADWRDQLTKTGLQVAISPLHDMDVWSLEDEQKNPEHKAGTCKKPHYHVILCYSGPTAYSVVKRITDSLNQPIPEALEQVKGMYDYLTHENNPEKYQYDKKDIQTLNGFSIRDFCEMTKSEVTKYKREIQTFIRDNGITEYGDLMDLLMDAEGMENHYEVASNNTLFFVQYLKTKWRNAVRAGRLPDDKEVLGK